jgi:hypothetical protein
MRYGPRWRTARKLFHNILRVKPAAKSVAKPAAKPVARPAAKAALPLDTKSTYVPFQQSTIFSQETAPVSAPEIEPVAPVIPSAAKLQDLGFSTVSGQDFAPVEAPEDTHRPLCMADGGACKPWRPTILRGLLNSKALRTVRSSSRSILIFVQIYRRFGENRRIR